MILHAGLRGIVNYGKISRCRSKVLSNINLTKFMGTGVQGYCSNIMLTVLYEMYNCLDQWFWKSFTYLLTYLLSPRIRVLIEKLTGFQLVKKFPAFYGTRRFITAFTSSCQNCPYSEPSQSSSCPHLPLPEALS